MMKTDRSVYDVLRHKKTKPDEKLKIITNIFNEMDTKSYDEGIDVIEKLIDLLGDKSSDVINVTFDIFSNFIQKCNFCLFPSLISTLNNGLEFNRLTKTKYNTLKLIYESKDKPNFRNVIPQLVEPLNNMLVDMSEECNKQSLEILSIVFEKLDNKDLNDLVPHLIKAMTEPNYIPTVIDLLSSTTFVQNVDAETLSVIVPILSKTFQYSTNSVKRQTIVIIENMTKLVEDTYNCLGFINILLPIVEYCKNEISDPEIRNVSERVFNHLIMVKNKGTEIKMNKETQMNNVIEYLKNNSVDFSDSHTNILNYLLSTSCLTNEKIKEYIPEFNDNVVENILNICNLNNGQNNTNDDDETAEELCNCEFTLGYGSKVLMHKTRLHLHRGYKYGLIGCNNSGKSTLMKAMASQQLESFPSELKSVYVETDILGELSHLSLVDYILEDERLKHENLSRELIESTLKSVGFTQQMLFGGVSTLSGGWRMKLALSRAMMQNADILLMDEPSAHLDVMNIKWLLDYIKGLSNVTCIIVSQNAKLLDECCTHILQIDNLKLHLSKGNLSEFSKTNPQVLSYFELKTNKYSFKFPKPRYLDGVKSKGKALMKMENVSFTYPNKPCAIPQNISLSDHKDKDISKNENVDSGYCTPSLNKPIITNASVQVSLSSRIGCLGPNGAGKSTSIKLLTGQLEPDQGKIWNFPGVKIGYIAQHAFFHIEQHLNKTPNEYIRWRYEGGEDKEDLIKVSKTMTQEELDKLKTTVLVECENSKSGQIKRTIKRLTYGRRTGKKEREYEVEFENCSADLNGWLTESDLISRGYEKLLKMIDSKCDASEGAYKVALTQENVENHLEHIGMTKENATHVKIKQLSNGEKVKVVIGAALWMQPHILILDEPTNNIDRDGLSALSEAIKEFEGGIIVITHDEQFCNTVCSEIWVIEEGKLNVKGDPEWMANALKTKTNFKLEEEMTDSNGNIIQVKQPKKVLSRREKIERQKKRKIRRQNGEDVSSSDDDF